MAASVRQDGAPFTQEEIYSMSLDTLRKHLKREGLSAEGKKRVLTKRLADHYMKKSLIARTANSKTETDKTSTEKITEKASSSDQKVELQSQNFAGIDPT